MSSPTRVLLDPKRQGDTKAYNQFDYAPLLAAGETITGTPTTTVSVWSGVDASPSSIISGTVSVSGSVCTQKFTAGVTGVLYLVKMTAVTSLSQTLTLVGILAVIPDGI